MVSQETLERLLMGKGDFTPNQGSQGRSKTAEKSSPTGWSRSVGTVTGQELRFPNGYTVMALQIEGQKSIIKGARAWLGVLSAVETEALQTIVSEWLERIAHTTPNIVEHDEESHHDIPIIQLGAMAAMEERLSSLTQAVEQLMSQMKK